MPIQVPRGFEIARAPTDQLKRSARFIQPKPTNLPDIARGLGEVSSVFMKLGAAATKKETKQAEAEDVMAATSEAANLSREFTRPIDDPFNLPDPGEEKTFLTKMESLSKTHGRTEASRQAIDEMISRRVIDAFDRSATRLHNAARVRTVVMTEQAFKTAHAAQDWGLTQDTINNATAAGMPRELVSRMIDAQREGRLFEGYTTALGPDGTDYEKAAAFVLDINERKDLTDEEKSSLTQRMRGDIDRRKALERSRDETQIAADDASAILNTGVLERGITQGEPITATQLDAAYNEGTLGTPNTAASARRLDALKDTLARTEETRLDVARLLDPNSLERPAPTGKRTGDAADYMLTRMVQGGTNPDVASVGVAQTTGRVPPRTEALVESQWRQPTTMGDALMTYTMIAEGARAAYWNIDADARASLELGFTLLSGYPPQQRAAMLPVVVEQVQAATIDLAPAVKQAREASWKLLRKEGVDQLLDISGTPGMEPLGFRGGFLSFDIVPEFVPTNMRENYMAIAQQSYMATGDATTSWRSAASRIMQTWQATSINADVEDANGDDIGNTFQWFGIPDENVKGARQQLTRDLKGGTYFAGDGTTTNDLDADQVEIRPFEPPRFTAEGKPRFQLMFKGAPLISEQDGRRGPVDWEY